MGLFEKVGPLMGIMFLIFIVMFIFVIVFMFSPKLRGKIMSQQVKSMKHMVNISKDDLANIKTMVGDISISSTKKIIEDNEDDLKYISSKSADISKDAVETIISAIKGGVKEDTIYCKHCGEKIDSDSTFCKICGKKQ